jgi:hypothetical protein
MLNKALQWYLITSTIVGVPVLALIIIFGAQRALYTVTCEVSRYRCDRSYIQGIDYIAEQVTEETDVVITPKKRR